MDRYFGFTGECHISGKHALDLVGAKKDYQYLLGADRCEQFQAQSKGRVDKMEPQLRATIRQDLEQLLAGHNCFNIDGYLKFTANKLKLLLQRLLQDEYIEQSKN